MSEGGELKDSSFLGNLSSIKEDMLGPSYSYSDLIGTPQELGMSERGRLDRLVVNAKAMKAYVDLLVTGQSRASKHGQFRILGSQFFTPTNTKCIDADSGREVDRSLYISNKASGFMPGVSDVTGVNLSMFRGLVPGMIQNMDALNPVKIFRAFTQSAKPKCAKVSLPIDHGTGPRVDVKIQPKSFTQTLAGASDGASGVDAKCYSDQQRKTGYVSLFDLSNLMKLDPCFREILGPELAEKVDAHMRSDEGRADEGTAEPARESFAADMVRTDDPDAAARAYHHLLREKAAVLGGLRDRAAGAAHAASAASASAAFWANAVTVAVGVVFMVAVWRIAMRAGRRV
jgi:hypothetical protein